MYGIELFPLCYSVTFKAFSSAVNALILLVCVASVVIVFVRVCIKHTLSQTSWIRCLPRPENCHGCHLLSRCPFLPCLCDKDFHTGLCSFYSGMCWRMCGGLALTKVSHALSLRFAVNLPNVGSFLKEGLSN